MFGGVWEGDVDGDAMCRAVGACLQTATTDSSDGPGSLVALKPSAWLLPATALLALALNTRDVVKSTEVGACSCARAACFAVKNGHETAVMK